MSKNEDVPLNSIFKFSVEKENLFSEYLITGEKRPVSKLQDEML